MDASWACSQAGSSVTLMNPGAATVVRPNDGGSAIAAASSLAMVIGGRRSVRASFSGSVTE